MENLITRHADYATFWQRLTAFFLDTFIVALPVFLFMLSYIAPMFIDVQRIKSSSSQTFEILHDLYQQMIFILIGGFSLISLVLAAFTVSRWQATPGKRLVGIYITRNNGLRPKLSEAFGRFVSLPMAILLIQVFERYQVYEKLNQVKATGKESLNRLDEFQSYLIAPASELTSLVLLFVVSLWFLRIFWSSDRTAIHDVFFHTIVVQGRR